jgi:hypothetical protein
MGIVASDPDSATAVPFIEASLDGVSFFAAGAVDPPVVSANGTTPVLIELDALPLDYDGVVHMRARDGAGGPVGAVHVTSARRPVVLFVDATPSSESWPGAYMSLTEALADARALALASETRVEVWLSEGTYHPEGGDDGERDVTFTLGSLVELFGGFADGEPHRFRRDVYGHPSVLSGDIGEPGVATDNALHVVTLDAGPGVFSIDGVVIESGRADRPGDDSGGGIYSGRDQSGVLYVTRTIVRDNFASLAGGGVAIDGDDVGGLGVFFTNNRIVDNVAGDSGGGFDFEHASGSLDGTVVARNAGFTVGGGRVRGGFVSFLASTIVANVADSDGVGGLSVVGFTANDAYSGVAQGTILHGNTGAQIARGTFASIGFVRCDVGGSGGSAAWNLPFGDSGGNVDADPLLDASFTPGAASAVVDLAAAADMPRDTLADFDGDGDNLEVVPVDAKGAARLSGAGFDIGAMER